MEDEFQVRMSCSHAAGMTRTVPTREAAELAARSQAREWAHQTAGHVEVQVTISRRQVTPWVQEGETYEVRSIDVD